MEITTEPIGPELPSRQTKRDASGARPPHMLGEALDNTKHDDANHVDSKTVRDSACRSATWVQGAFLAALIVMPVGCAPSLDTVTITQGPDVNLIQVEARIRGAAAVNLGTPTLGIALVSGAQTPTFHQVGNMSLVTAPLYRRDAVAVPQGVIRAQVTVPYSVLFQFGTRTLTRTQDFTVAAPAGCFFFDGGNAGWTADGFFDIAPPPPGTRINICPGQSPFLARGSNFPQAYTSAIPGGDFSSLAIVTNVPCIATPPLLQGGFVTFDFVSPDLTGAVGWTGANGFELKASVPFGAPTAANQVRTQLIFQDTAGQFHAEVGADGQPVIHNLTVPWQALSMTRPGFDIARLHVRMFIPVTNGLASPDSVIEIDQVCPRTGN